MKFGELIGFLFPEGQIFKSIEERGFIAHSNNQSVAYQNQSVQQVYTGNNNVQQQAAPVNQGMYAQTAQSSQTQQASSGTMATTNNNAAVPKSDDKTLARATEAFNTLPMDLKQYWVGADQEKVMLSKAFQRPYLMGFNNVKPRNTILIIGSESRGKTYAIQCISSILAQKKVFKNAVVSKVDMSEYAIDSDNSLFLSDLYKALNTESESVVFENIDKASVAHLDIIHQLITTGSYKLAKRFMASEGGLVEATGVLNTGIVSEINANGKYIIFSTVMSYAKIMSFLGNKITKEINDVINLEKLDENQITDLAYTLCCNLQMQCKKQLHINVTFDNNILPALAGQYNEVTGVKGLDDHITENLYETLVEMKLQGVISDEFYIRIAYNQGYCALIGNNVIMLGDYLKSYGGLELEDAKKELDEVIGLAKVKEYVMNLETNFNVQKLRESKGYKKTDISMHMIFTGNPGTGKTTIARIVAKYLKAIGVLSSGHLCEVTRADLVGQYAGHTAVKTNEVINSALGGVLFIDEAYSLCRDDKDNYGIEAVDALVKAIEDHRDDLVVILAGYDDEMEDFLKANSGLKSRFPNKVHFDDYTIDEMYQIAMVTAKSKGYKIGADCEDGLKAVFEKHQIKGKNDGGNGRLVRNLIEVAIIEQSKRIASDPECDMELLSADDFGLNKKNEFDLEGSLKEIIGLEEVKSFIRTQYAMLQADKKRRQANIEVDTKQSLNMVFTGNPGTGKTTMARVVADMFHSMDILKSGHLVEVDRGGLISGYVGKTAEKTEEVFKSALGGVLFIDEAYAITSDKSGVGQECIDTLVKLIEDYRGEILVILAGYSKEMRDFMKANSGLESRFPLQIEFSDYSSGELNQIFLKMLNSRGFYLGPGADKAAQEEISRMKRQSDASSGNGRMIRNFVEDIIRRQSMRIVNQELSEKELTMILPEDVVLENAANQEYDLEAEFSHIIGMDSVKKYIRSLNARLKLQAERKKAGLKIDNTQTMHMIFSGNPGTGKTMMARTVANVLYHMNVIPTNKLVETDRAGLVAGYVGQTAMKTKGVIESALGGVLFIDEAYTLAQGSENDFGQEAIDTLVKLMDDNRDRLVVILAGYSDDMKRFLEMNAGLSSRFPNNIEFPDYSTDELMMIADGMYSEQGYVLSEDGREMLRDKLEVARQNKQFGNGRYVRNVFERSLNNQALRLSTEEELTRDELVTITEKDLQEG